MPIESSYPPLDIPNVDIWRFLFERQDREYPDDKVIFVDADTNRSYTYASVKQTASEFGAGLKALWDWKKGDVLAFYTPNSIDTPVLTWGCHWAGGIVASANSAWTAEELAFHLKDAGAKALVTQLASLELAREAARQAGVPEDRIILLGDKKDPTMRFKHFSSIKNFSAVERYRRTRVDPKKDLAFLAYSSGTTGLPKGVMLSHENIVSNLLMNRTGEGGNLTWNGGKDGQGDKILAFLPFFHLYGLTCLMHQPLYLGLTSIVMLKFDLRQFCSIIQTHRITYSYVVPPVVLLLGKHPLVDKYDLSSVRMLNSGAAPLTRELVESVYGRLKIPIKQGYGLTETSPTTHLQPWELWEKTIGSVGTLLPNQTAKFLPSDSSSPSDSELPPGSTGELYVRGPNIFKGYHKNPSATAAAISQDGYFRTGDVGYVDAQGNFYITDRIKELIKYKGFQVAPAELEGILVTHPAVEDVAVVGVYDKSQATELPKAFIVLRTGQAGRNNDHNNDMDVKKKEEGEKEEIKTWLNLRVASYKQLRGGIKFVEHIPKSASGKILRRVLRDAEQQQQEEEVAVVVKAKL